MKKVTYLRQLKQRPEPQQHMLDCCSPIQEGIGHSRAILVTPQQKDTVPTFKLLLQRLFNMSLGTDAIGDHLRRNGCMVVGVADAGF